MPTATEFSKTTQEQVLDGIKQGQKAVIDAVGAWAKTVENIVPATPSIPRLPLAEGIPTVEQVVAESFAFAEKLIASQRDFALQVLAVVSPAVPGKDAAKKSA